MVKVRGDARALQGELKFPCLIMALVEHLGRTFSDELEKEFYDKDNYTEVNWLEFKKRSRANTLKKKMEEEKKATQAKPSAPLKVTEEEEETSEEEEADSLLQEVEEYEEEVPAMGRKEKRREITKRKLIDKSSEEDEEVLSLPWKKLRPRRREVEKGKETKPKRVERTWEEVEEEER